jgi:hypothetical protein
LSRALAVESSKVELSGTWSLVWGQLAHFYNVIECRTESTPSIAPYVIDTLSMPRCLISTSAQSAQRPESLLDDRSLLEQVCSPEASPRTERRWWSASGQAQTQAALPMLVSANSVEWPDLVEQLEHVDQQLKI